MWRVWLVCLAVPFSAWGAVLRYDVTTVSRTALAQLPADHWAQYNEEVAARGTVSSVSAYDDAPLFESLNVTSPFFSYDNVTWYVSSDAFLSPTPVPMCTFFCTEASLSTMVGYYQFGSGIYGGGGDWPMVGLYVMDLDPSRSGGGGVRVLRVSGVGGAADGGVVVEYKDVPPSGVGAGGVPLTAQVEVRANGTIIMRYRSLAVNPSAPRGLGASVGLVLSKEERVVVSTPEAGADSTAAIRYDPVVDDCVDNADEASCAAAAGGGCGWCAATARCMDTSLSLSLCPSRSFHTAAVATAADDYYRVKISYDVPLVNLTLLPNVTRVLPAGSLPPVVELELGFDFPYFTRNQTSHSTNTTYLLSSGALSVFSRQQDCAPIWNVCPNGNYTFAIMPFVTAAQWVRETSVAYVRLPARTQDDPLCDAPQCPAGILVAVDGMPTVLLSKRWSAYQIYLDADGAVELRYGRASRDGALYGSSDALFGHPRPFVGLVRYRVDDRASVMVPLTLVRSGARIRFEPVGLCNDCGRNGTCDAAGTGQCACDAGFSGALCEECASGRYGPQCRECPVCQNRGHCDDGINGKGRCVCTGLYSGRDCSVLCSGPFDCSGCSGVGGYCECGACVCDAAAGWGGPHCDVVIDQCRRYSFDGCGVCGSNVSLDCAFCFDSVCYSPSLDGTATGHACSHSTPPQDARLCVPFTQPVQRALDFGYVTVAVVCIAAVVCAVAIAAIVRLVVTSRNVQDIHVAGAAGGAPDHRAVRREREVVQAVFIQPNAGGDRTRHVLGIPLKQVSLKALCEKQRGSHAEKKQS